ncbi:LysR family transcriptional regulator, partial [Mesorhizobium sp.]
MSILNRVHLNGLRAVETVARLGSLSAAASELNVSASAVSQQVKRTEEQLGQALFERTASGLVLTEFGNVFTARLGAGFRELAQA